MKAPEFIEGFIRDDWHYSHVRPTGFEPATLWTGTIRSNPTELRAHLYINIIQNFPLLQLYFQLA